MNSLEWLKKSDNPKMRLFCFPYAGGGPMAFRSWLTLLPKYCDLISIQLPGREKRLSDQCFTVLEDVLSELQNTIPVHLDVPYVFFGHSMGALIAFELLKKFQLLNLQSPRLLVVSACMAPQDIFQRPKTAHLSDNEFIEKLRGYQGTPNSILNDMEILQIFLPRLRSDMKVLESYDFTNGNKLNCPILGLCGKEDYSVPLHLFSNWKEMTLMNFCQEQYQGGHFYINHHKQQVIDRILNDENI